jgi:hypothetical protein
VRQERKKKISRKDAKNAKQRNFFFASFASLREIFFSELVTSSWGFSPSQDSSLTQ